MNRLSFYKRNDLVKVLFISSLLMQSCNNSNETKAVNSVDDTIHYHKNETNSTLNDLHNKEDATDEAGRQMILMQIDSTYYAIAVLDSAKEQLTNISPSSMNLAERNKRSKIIFNINLMQNELIREMDAAILTNLKNRTSELNNIATELEKNAAQLSSMVQQINKVTRCVSRLTSILSEGLSRGLIKPLTPKGVSAETIKANI